MAWGRNTSIGTAALPGIGTAAGAFADSDEEDTEKIPFFMDPRNTDREAFINPLKTQEALEKRGDLPSAMEEDEKALQAMNGMNEAWDGLEVPELGDLTFEDYSYLGDYTPTDYTLGEDLVADDVDALPDVEWEDSRLAPDVQARTAQASLMGPSAFEGVSADPRLRDSQFDALGSLDEIIDGGGLTMRDQANLQKVRSDVGASDRGRRDALMQNMQARGMGGSGMELLAALQSGQAATDREAQAGLEQAAIAQERAQNAMLQRGQMAGNMRGQDFDEASRVAQARDAIQQFNAANSTNTSQFNAGQVNNMGQFNAGRTDQNNQFNALHGYQAGVNNRDYTTGVQQWNAGQANNMAQFNRGNQVQVGLANKGATDHAGQANTDRRQGVANASVDTRNKATQWNKAERPMSQFDMNAKKTQGKSDANKAAVEFWTKKGDQDAQKSGQLMGGATSIFGAILSDERSKEDVSEISDADIEEFLEALKPKSFRYKKQFQAQGGDDSKAGFMLQDVQGTKAGELLTNEGDGEDDLMSYDPQTLDGLMLAAIKKLAAERGDDEENDDVAV